jgi:SAM-dependent methyltransferase
MYRAVAQQMQGLHQFVANIRRELLHQTDGIMPHLSASDEPRQARFFSERLRALRSRHQPRAHLPRLIDRFPFSLSFVRGRLLRLGERVSNTRRQIGLSLLELVELLHGEFRDGFAQMIRNLDTVHRDALAAQLDARETSERLDAVLRRLETVERRMQNLAIASQLPASEVASPAVNEAMYSAFEERFRGSEELILERASIYVPMFMDAKRHTRSGRSIDIGCGRGELLELLKSEGFDARGVEINAVQAERCIARGFNVVVEDGIEHLKSLEDESVSVITCFHVIEHLPFNRMLDLFREAHRVLEPGGLALFETPNGQNLFVLANIFYIDPTHIRPLPSEMLTFFGEACGFKRVKCMMVNPQMTEPPAWAGTPEMGRWLLDNFYGPQDCALVGWKGDH